MIKNFNDKETEKIFNGVRSKKYSLEMQVAAIRRLKYLNNALSLDDLRIPPSNHLEALHGRPGVYSIRINQQWRITFRWQNGAEDVKIEDYH